MVGVVVEDEAAAAGEGSPLRRRGMREVLFLDDLANVLNWSSAGEKTDTALDRLRR